MSACCGGAAEGIVATEETEGEEGARHAKRRSVRGGFAESSKVSGNVATYLLLSGELPRLFLPL